MSDKEELMKAERQIGTSSRRLRSMARLIGQGAVTLGLIAFDVVKSATGGGNSSSAFTPVILPGAESDSAPLGPDRKVRKKPRRTKRRTN